MIDVATLDAGRDPEHIISWRGRLTGQQRTFLLNTAEKLIAPLRVRRRFCRAMIEVMENAAKHGSHLPAFPPAIAIRKKHDTWRLVAENTVTSCCVKELSSTLQSLGSLDNSERDKQYRMRLKNAQFNSTGGAGLGLAYIARSATGNIRFTFSDLHNGHHLFRLAIDIV